MKLSEKPEKRCIKSTQNSLINCWMGNLIIVYMGLLGNIFRATVTVAVTPLAVVKDVVTLGGTLTDEKT